MLLNTLNSVHAHEHIFNNTIYFWPVSVFVTSEGSHFFIHRIYVFIQQVNIISKDQKQVCFIQFYTIFMFLDHPYYILQSGDEM